MQQRLGTCRDCGKSAKNSRTNICWQCEGRRSQQEGTWDRYQVSTRRLMSTAPGQPLFRVGLVG